MAIPLKYNTRHLLRRWKTISMTVFAIGLVVAVFISVLSLANGLNQAFATSGDARNILVMRDGSTSETNSTILRSDYYNAKFLQGIAVDSSGNPLIAYESTNIASLPKIAGGNTNASIRGVSAMSMKVRPTITIAEGRMIQPGLNELMVGTGAAGRFSNAKIGDTIRLVKSNWKIVGRFDANRTAFDSEFWGDVDQIGREFDRTVYSTLLIQAESEEEVDQVLARFEGNEQLSNLKPQKELAYYKDQTKGSAPIQFLGLMISSIMAVGAVFAAMNAMYASVSSRSREIATLRVLGFTRSSILLAFSLESLFLGVLGGIIGILLAMPINGINTGTTNFASFSEITFAFKITPQLQLMGLAFASFIGVAGGLLPAFQASRTPIIDGLKGKV